MTSQNESIGGQGRFSVADALTFGFTARVADVIRTPEGKACLNVGCGGAYFPEWTNCDLLPGRQVVGHDLRDPLPWQTGTFDAVYSSHVLEHLTEEAGMRQLADQFRVLKSGGVCRVVVPDLEGLCREYLKALEGCEQDRNAESLRRYRWAVVELLDQMVREESGGALRKLLNSGEIDKDQAGNRFGDAFLGPDGARVTLDNSRTDAGEASLALESDWGAKMARRWAKWKLNWASGGGSDPRKSGEVHRWMYDRISLIRMLEEVGFERCEVLSYDRSSIPDWDKYNLDVSRHGPFPRKPDSLFVEGIKP